MIRTITKSSENKLTLDLPDDLVGKMIEIIAFSIEDTNPLVKDLPANPDKVADLKNKLKDFTWNSGGYKFNRDDANDYEYNRALV